MLRIFVDDSGTDGTAEFCVLAGYVSDEDGWTKFSDEWQEELDAYPCLKYFKMRESESLRGQFFGWSREQKDEKVLRLASIAQGRARYAVASVISHGAYDDFARGGLPKTVDSPYWFCFQGIVSECFYLFEQTGCKIDFVFDIQGEGYERRAHAIFAAMHAEMKGTPLGAALGSLTFANDLDVLPLQSADLLAWHCRRHFQSMLAGRGKEVRPSADVVFDVPTLVKAWRPDDIANFVEMYQSGHPNGPRRTLDS